MQLSKEIILRKLSDFTNTPAIFTAFSTNTEKALRQVWNGSI